MNSFLHKKWVAWVVLILLLLNISALATILYFTYNRHFNHFPPRDEARIRPGKELIKELGMNSSQAEVFCNIRQEFFSDIKPSLQQLRKQRKKIAEEMNRENPDTNYIFSLADSVGKIQAGLKKETVRHYFRIRKICNAEQRQKLAGLYSAMFMMDDPVRGQGMGMRYRHGWQKGQGQGMQHQQMGRGCIYANDSTDKQ